MRLFPIGTIANGSDSGTTSGVTYTFFEPNSGCKSGKVHNILVSRFQNQTAMTRKVTDPFIQIKYDYEDIYNREFKAIENFVDSVDEALTSFLVVDFDNGKSPSSVSSVLDTWEVVIDSTDRYSSVTNYKSNKMFLWDGVSSWRIGTVSDVDTNATVTMDLTGSLFGALTLANASAKAYVYPVYTAYLGQGALSSFKNTEFLKENVTLGSDGGWMKSGNVEFISKYKV